MDEHNVPSRNTQQQKLELSCGRDGHQQHAQQQVNRYHHAVLGDTALPGFRFHPTEEELVGYYLRRMVEGRRNNVELIASVDLYQHDPWELPALALMGEKEWFFFCPRDKKYPNGARPNRVTASGYWKATGTDRAVRCNAEFRCCVGLKKTLVFYTGRAPRGNKTDWIMNEYRLPKRLDNADCAIFGSNSCKWRSSMTSAPDDGEYTTESDVALCRIYRKSSSAVGGSMGAATLHSQCFLAKVSCSNGSTSQLPDQFPQQQVTLPPRIHVDPSQQVSTSNPRTSCCQPSQRPAPAEAALARLVEGTTASETWAPSTSNSLSCAVNGIFAALPYAPRLCHQRPQATALAANSNSLRSSHALMAKLLMEESSCATCRIDLTSLGSSMPVDHEDSHRSSHHHLHAEEQRKSFGCEIVSFTGTSQKGQMVIDNHHITRT